MPRTIDLSGNRYGKWTVTGKRESRLTKSSGSVVFWECICECGQSSWIRSYNLRSGNSTQCFECQSRALSKKYEGVDILRKLGKRLPRATNTYISGDLWSRIQTSARLRDIEINISKSFIMDLFNKQGGRCALCGIDLIVSGKELTDITASLDRIDSSRGYLEDNVQWVHKRINIMKGVLLDEEFIKFCHLVSEHQKIKE